MSDRLLVATRKGLFDIRKTRGRWKIAHRSFMGEPVSMVLRDQHSGSLYAALHLGHFGAKLHRSDGDGRNWTEVNTPSYTGYGDTTGETAPSLKMIWSLETGPAGTLWAGTLPGGLFKSTDKGENWTLMEGLWNQPSRSQWFGGGYDEPGIHSICVDPRDAGRLAIAVSCGGVWLSGDNGENWQIHTNGMWADYMPPEEKDNPAIQDPHRMVQCPGSPETFWVQHHNGIFRTSDGCKNWTGISAEPSSFGFAVAVHPQKPDTAWFAPAINDEKRYPVDGKFIVSRTEDGGKTFTSLTNGLPAEESYDLVYRHGLEVDSTGDGLAVASTTGSLWFSGNGGDNWQLFSSHLPPIYAIRFV